MNNMPLILTTFQKIQIICEGLQSWGWGSDGKRKLAEIDIFLDKWPLAACVATHRRSKLHVLVCNK